MNSVVRRIREMVARVVSWIDAWPDTDAGQMVSAARLKEVRTEMEQVAALQRAGLIAVHTGAGEKRRLRREMLAGPIAHLSEVGGLAGRGHPHLGNKLPHPPGGKPSLAPPTPAPRLQAGAGGKQEGFFE